MTENKGDLISREALKESVINNFDNLQAYFPKDFIEEIDNAPTVEPPNQLVLRARDDAELEQLKTAWGNGEICFTPIVAYTARPQGEWIIIKSPLSTETVVKCPFCHDEFIGNDVEHYNYCPICNADLRGKEK